MEVPPLIEEPDVLRLPGIGLVDGIPRIVGGHLVVDRGKAVLHSFLVEEPVHHADDVGRGQQGRGVVIVGNVARLLGGEVFRQHDPLDVQVESPMGQQHIADVGLGLAKHIGPRQDIGHQDRKERCQDGNGHPEARPNAPGFGVRPSLTLHQTPWKECQPS
jgi:hypothetical protein